MRPSRVIPFLRQCCVAAAFVVVVATLPLLGCASSEEAGKWEETTPPEPGLIDLMQKTIDSLRADNSKLRSQVMKLEQENRNLVARAAELETRLAGEREKVKPEPKMIGDAKGEYDRGLSMFRQRRYQDAISTFMGLLNTAPPEELEGNCHYWIGESYYGMKQYRGAISHFEKVLTYSRSTKIDDAQIMVANSYLRMGDKARAKQEYQKLLDRYPASPYAKIARGRLAKL